MIKLEFAQDISKRLRSYFERMEAKHPGQWRASLELAAKLEATVSPGAPSVDQLTELERALAALPDSERKGAAFDEMKVTVAQLLRRARTA